MAMGQRVEEDKGLGAGTLGGGGQQIPMETGLCRGCARYGGTSSGLSRHDATGRKTEWETPLNQCGPETPYSRPDLRAVSTPPAPVLTATGHHHIPIAVSGTAEV